jgi:hypothetical protein
LDESTRTRSGSARSPSKKRQKLQGRQTDDEDTVEPETSGVRGANNIAETVKKMKNVLSPKKMKEKAVDPDAALVHVVQPDEIEDYIQNADDDDYSPMASTIIIVKPNDHDPTVTPIKSIKKEVPRVHTVTMSSGKQIVYKSKKGNKKEKSKGDDSIGSDDEDLDEGEKSKTTGSKSTPKPKKRGRKSKVDISDDEDEDDKEKSLIQKWKSVGVEGEQLGSGDVIITAEDLKNATEANNETEYNFDDDDRPASRKTPSILRPAGGGKLKITMPNQRVPCMVCGKNLLNYSYLYRHVRQYHRDIQDVDQYLDEIKPLMKTPCPLCGKEISSISNMSSHIQQCHPSTPEPYRCEECGGFYKTRISLKHHMQSQHTTNRKSYPCKYCGNIFTEARSLKEHINCSHETTEVFSCEVCKKNFLTRGRLRRHMYIHGEFRLFCKYCGKGFHLKDMNKHIDLMHEKKSANKFKCEYCSRYNGVHLKTLPYRCPICDHGFRKKSHMLAHMKEHAVRKSEYDVEDSMNATEEEEDDETEGEESMTNVLHVTM